MAKNGGNRNKRTSIWYSDKVKVGNDQETVQSERNSHPKNRDGKKTKLTTNIKLRGGGGLNRFNSFMIRNMPHEHYCRWVQEGMIRKRRNQKEIPKK